ncbi:MAG: GH116 family glycosyl hydrolase [Thermomicrobiales bacterium]
MVEADVQKLAGRAYRGEAVRAIAMPLGGIGTGQVSLCGDGGLRQWQIFNQSNHLAFVPDSFFALRAGSAPGPSGGITRILQSETALALPFLDTPLINDDIVPVQQRALIERFGGVTETVFTSRYPFAQIDYRFDAWPVSVQLDAFSPFVPLDSADSSLPAAHFRFTVRNTSLATVWGALGATLKNVVGWDTISPIEGNANPGFGGNVNVIDQEGNRTSIVMEQPGLAWNDPYRGQLALSTSQPDPIVLPAWNSPSDFIGAMERFDFGADPPGAAPDPMIPVGVHRMRARASMELARSQQPHPSPPGHTANGGLLLPFVLEPGEARELDVLLSWSFPNFYVNYDQPTPNFREELTRSRLWLGNAYSTRYANAIATARDVFDRLDDLRQRSQTWTDAVLSSSLPTWLADFLLSQGALIRSPTIFQTADGKLYGFEGTQGASTSMLGWKGFGGSCPLNCTHVWEYEQALSRLFPDLERTMRETDFDYVQAPEGYIPHRTLLPLFVKQLWGCPIGGPTNPALDGMLSTVLKTWREIRQGAGPDWAARYWPNVRHLMRYISATWDPDGDGVLAGEQPNTYDIEFYGTNMLIGSLWLAALRASEAYATQQGDETFAQEMRALFERGSEAYDRLLWNGEYYIQTLGPDDPREQQYLTGCLADQLIGQWWAHQLDLGYLLPRDRVKKTLESILAYNLREGFEGYDPEERAFANGDDVGLLIIAWPAGGRPDRPTRYHDEVWTGIEYQVAAHCIYEGLVDEGLRLMEAVRARYDGAKRNPFNDIECGDHYARAMSGWTVLEALAGYRYDATALALAFDPVLSTSPARFPFVAGTGWGTASIDASGVCELHLMEGSLTLAQLGLPSGAGGKTASKNGSPLEASEHNGVYFFDRTLEMVAGDVLTLH